MVHDQFRPSSSLRFALLTLGVSVLPIGTAYAQSFGQNNPTVKVAKDEVSIMSSLYPRGGAVMRATEGTTFEVIFTEGDRYSARKDNWYWVLLPRDSWGTQRVGWVSGRDVEYVPPVRETKQAMPEPSVLDIPKAPEPADTKPAETGLPVDANADAQPAVVEVVLNFAFAKSDLTDEAKGKLAEAVAALKADVQSVTIALEGHADATGAEPFNEKLGLARAENVKRYLAEQHHVSVEKISLVSFGETQPAAPNTTKEGRAQNRRVVVKVG